jgi:hypothetical protein
VPASVRTHPSVTRKLPGQRQTDAKTWSKHGQNAVICGADLATFMVKTQRFTTTVVQKFAPSKNPVK